MQDDTSPEKVSSPFMRAIAAHHTRLIGEREAILVDLQVIDERREDDFSSAVATKLDELTDVDQKLYTIKKYFAPDEGEKT